MRKGNWLILIFLTLFSGILLWLWYALGLNRINSSMESIWTVIWWIVIVVSVASIIRVEQERKKRIRTIYVGRRALFNSEAGLVPYETFSELIEDLAGVLSGLDYGFDKEDLPKPEYFPVKYLVRTDEFDGETWRGCVLVVETQETKHFSSKSELVRIMNLL